MTAFYLGVLATCSVIKVKALVQYVKNEIKNLRKEQDRLNELHATDASGARGVVELSIGTEKVSDAFQALPQEDEGRLQGNKFHSYPSVMVWLNGTGDVVEVMPSSVEKWM